MNVKKQDLCEAIIKVWKSCTSFRAKIYSEKKVLLKMGIIIQFMAKAKYSGIIFTKHLYPSNIYENNNVVIEVAPLSGEKIVQGQITPFRMSATVDKILNSTDSLWIGSLIENVLILKERLKHEVDIEFVVDSNEKFG